MPQVFPTTLTRSSLDALKREVHAALPSIKSTHLAEALAAAVGYRTYASLRAALAASPTLTSSLGQTESRLAFNERLYRLGYPAQAYATLSNAPEGLDIVAQVRALAGPEPVLANTPALDRCHSYGVVMRRKADGGIFATHPVAGALGPYETLEAAAQAACDAWL